VSGGRVRRRCRGRVERVRRRGEALEMRQRTAYSLLLPGSRPRIGRSATPLRAG